ncbi:MAG TPA: hypothetical protein VF503_19885 [Sphingobium sp.]|uniref:hypothetical protein n=1 Tax=Sphingobium sp. TaxID=1912891 RepID=UPI002ED66B66
MTHAADTWDLYFKSASALQESISRNAEDGDFSQDEKEIIYIFDANIFVFEADVTDEQRLTENIDNLVGGGPRQLEIAKVLERLTAEFLFSGKLPGQRDGKAYITLPHLSEAIDVSRAIARNLDQQSRNQMSPFEKDEVRDEVRNIVDAPGTVAEKLRELSAILPATWLASLEPRAHFQRALVEAFRKPGSLIPLDMVKWGRAAAELRHDDVQPWLNLMPEVKLPRTVDNNRADAISLATITNLYLDDKTARGPDRERQYLLVTSDRALANAVRQRMPVLRTKGIPNFVRLPEDFLPLINMNSMSLALSQVPADAKLRNAFANIFASIRMAVHWIALVKREGDAKEAKFPLDKDPLTYLQEAWRSIADYVAVLNLPYARDAAWLIEDLKIYLTPGTKAEAAALVETAVLEVSDQHLMIVLEATLAAMKREKSAIARPRRVHLQVLGDLFSKLLPSGDLNSFLTSLIEEGKLSPHIRAAMEREREGAEVQLLAACLFIAGDRWSLATQAASRGLQLLEQAGANSSNRLDARYLVAHCLRFSMRREFDLQRAKHLLEQNLLAYGSHGDRTSLATFRRLRDEIEFASLLITAAILEALAPTSAGRKNLGVDAGWHLFPTISSNAHSYLADGVHRLRSALENLDRDGSNVDSASANSLKRQAITNLLEAFIFERIGPGLQGDHQIFGPEAKDLIERLGGFMNPCPDASQMLLLTHHIYYWRGRGLIAESESERRQYIDNLKTFLIDGKKTHKLPLIDLIEFQFIEDQLLLVNSS